MSPATETQVRVQLPSQLELYCPDCNDNKIFTRSGLNYRCRDCGGLVNQVYINQNMKKQNG